MTKLRFEIKRVTTLDGVINGVIEKAGYILLDLDNISSIEGELVQHENKPVGVMLRIHGLGNDGYLYGRHDLPIISDGDFQTLMKHYEVTSA